MNERKIITTHVYPPIPVRQFDWSAHFDGDEEGGPYGRGATEQDAITDLMEQVDMTEPKNQAIAATPDLKAAVPNETAWRGLFAFFSGEGCVADFDPELALSVEWGHEFCVQEAAERIEAFFGIPAEQAKKMFHNLAAGRAAARE